MTMNETKCCFEHCDKPATRKLGGDVFFPMCEQHAESVQGPRMICFRFNEYVQGEPTGVFSEVRAADLAAALDVLAAQQLLDDYDQPLVASVDYEEGVVSWNDGDIQERFDARELRP